MSWAEYGGATSGPSRGRLVAVAIVVAAGLTIATGVLVSSAGDRTAGDRRSAAPGTTTVPSAPGAAGAGAGATGGSDRRTTTDGPGAVDEQASVGDPDDANRVLTPEQLAAAYPQDASGLDAATFGRATAAAAALTTASVTGAGRDQFPSMWTASDDAPVVADDFHLDFVTAAAVAAAPGYVRTVSVWHGTTRAGVPLRQVRVANYFQVAGDRLLPLQPGALPVGVANADPLVAGVSVPG